jgi:uncharacterized membrane protein
MESPQRRRSRLALAALLLVMGTLHFAVPRPFDRLIPTWLGSPRFWTYASGVGELACGALLLVPRTRRLGAWCSLALFVAVYPGNLTMAFRAGVPHDAESWAAWIRLPFQVPLWWWAHSLTRDVSADAAKRFSSGT